MSYLSNDPDPLIVMFIGFILGGIATFITFKFILTN